jgi:NADH dehydrogenase
MTHVVIVGAGFAGLSTVSGLRKADVQVTIIDKNLYSTFQPLLYQVATGGLNPGDVAYSVGGFVHQYGKGPRQHANRYIRGEVAALDSGSKRLKLTDSREIGYDYLILATGVSAAFFGVEGAAENTCGLYTRVDAIALRNHITTGYERMSEEGAGRDFSVVVVGGGATGVEMAGTLGELRGAMLRATFPDVDPGRVHVHLVEMAPALLMPFDTRLRDYTRRQLVERGVDIRLGTKIAAVRPDSVLLDDGQVLPSDLTVWAAGIAAPAVTASWGLPQGKGGRILVDHDLRVRGQDAIFAIGDIALNPDAPAPQLAQPALQMGRHAAAQITRLVAGEQTVPFAYHDKGIMATIGRRSAVVQFPRGMRITWTLAWLAWLALHLFYLLGYRNRIATLINLTWRYLAWGHGGVIVGDDPPPSPPAGMPSPGGTRAGTADYDHV